MNRSFSVTIISILFLDPSCSTIAHALSLSLSLSNSLSLCLSLSNSLCLFLSVSLCLCLSNAPGSIYSSLCLCVSVFPVHQAASTVLSVSVSLQSTRQHLQFQQILEEKTPDVRRWQIPIFPGIDTRDGETWPLFSYTFPLQRSAAHQVTTGPARYLLIAFSQMLTSVDSPLKGQHQRRVDYMTHTFAL